MGGSSLYERCGHRKVMPYKSFENFKIHHMSNNKLTHRRFGILPLDSLTKHLSELIFMPLPTKHDIWIQYPPLHTSQQPGKEVYYILNEIGNRQVMSKKAHYKSQNITPY